MHLEVHARCHGAAGVVAVGVAVVLEGVQHVLHRVAQSSLRHGCACTRARHIRGCGVGC